MTPNRLQEIKQRLRAAQGFHTDGNLWQHVQEFTKHALRDADWLIAEVEKLTEKLRREQAFNATSNEMNATFVHSLDVIQQHFTDEWTLKGDGQWRVDEIVKHLRIMDAAHKEALAADDAAVGAAGQAILETKQAH